MGTKHRMETIDISAKRVYNENYLGLKNLKIHRLRMERTFFPDHISNVKYNWISDSILELIQNNSNSLKELQQFPELRLDHIPLDLNLEVLSFLIDENIQLPSLFAKECTTISELQLNIIDSKYNVLLADQIINFVPSQKISLTGELSDISCMLIGENNFLDNINVSNIVHPFIQMLTWQSTPHYWGLHYGVNTIQSVSLELIELLERNMDTIKIRFPNITEFHAHLTMPTMPLAYKMSSGSLYYATLKFEKHDDFIKELKVFAKSQISIKSKLSNSYFDVTIYVERVQVKEKFDEEKFKKLASLSTNMIIQRSNLTRMFIANEYCFYEREYSCYDLIIKYERSNQ